jgi:hypothetical protein
MFTDRSDLLRDNPTQLNYGVAVVDVLGNGQFAFFVAGFGFANQALCWDGSGYRDVAGPVLADETRRAIGVAAGDIDGDGREEIYILNTDTFAGPKHFADRLFDFHDGTWHDLFAQPQYRSLANLAAGRSVACIDRSGQGRYGFFVANYGRPMRLYELDSDGQLVDMAPELGMNFTTGGRSLLVGPILSNYQDLFAANEHGSNFFFRNRGDGHFDEIAQSIGLADDEENGRGVAILDADGDGLWDIVLGNWEGRNRLFMQETPGYFRDRAPLGMALPTTVRTVIAADFDNDGYEEILFNNIGEPNRLFARRKETWSLVEIGDALEPEGLGTGGAVADLDGDGRLELLLAHGESNVQPLSLYHGPANANAWLRVRPLTPSGAPARGALVLLHAAGRTQRRIIDGGSGYLCQMEPVAHFGLGSHETVEWVRIRWPHGATLTLDHPAVRTTHIVSPPPL